MIIRCEINPINYFMLSCIIIIYFSFFREQLELMKKGIASDSDSSGHGPSEDGDSTDTEGPQNESDEAQEENSLDDTTETECERLRLKKLPKCLHVGRQVADECNVDVERHNARRFVKTLRSDLIPTVLTLRSNIEVDEALQNFASEYCQGKHRLPCYHRKIRELLPKLTPITR